MILFLITPCGKGMKFKVTQRVVQISYAISRICETAWTYSLNTLSFSLYIYDKGECFESEMK